MSWKVHVSYLSKMICVLCLFFTLLVGCTTRPLYYLDLYYAKTCPVCKSFINNVIPVLEEDYGKTMEITYYDIDEEASMDAYAKTCSLLEDYYFDDDSGSVPFIVLDGYFAKVGYVIGQQEDIIQAIKDAIANQPISSSLSDIYYFKEEKTFH